VVTVDSLFEGPDAPPLPELVKVDAEGYEPEVLAGAERILAHAEVVVLEAALFTFRPGQPTLVDLVHLMDEHGFRPYDLPWFLRRPLDGALGLADVAFARRDGRLRRDKRWAGTAARAFEGSSSPSWFGILDEHARRVERNDMDAIRRSIARGVVVDKDL
jgi:hypothetical protein